MAWEREKKIGWAIWWGEKETPRGWRREHVGEGGSGEFRGWMVGGKEAGGGARYLPILDRRDRKLLFWEGCQGMLGSSRLLPRHVLLLFQRS